jgi:hypothetical protein
VSAYLLDAEAALAKAYAACPTQVERAQIEPALTQVRRLLGASNTNVKLAARALAAEAIDELRRSTD